MIRGPHKLQLRNSLGVSLHVGNLRSVKLIPSILGQSPACIERLNKIHAACDAHAAFGILNPMQALQQRCCQIL